MKKFFKIISLILVFSLIFTGLPIQYVLSNDGEYVYAGEEGIQDSLTEVGLFSGMDKVTVTEAVYSDEQIVALDVAWLTADLVLQGNAYEVYEYEGGILYYNITNDLYLPDHGENGSLITWISSEESVIQLDGTVHRPPYFQRARVVILTATLMMGEAKAEKTFEIEVLPLDPSEDELNVEADYNWLVGETVIHYGVYFDDIRSNVILPKVGEKGGSIISWVSSNPDCIDTDGKVTQPPFAYAKGAAPVTLTATISKGGVSVEKTFELEVYPLYPTAEDHVEYDRGRLTDELILNGNSATDVKSRLYLPKEFNSQWWRDIRVGGCEITWQSSNPEVIAIDGQVSRPAKGQESVQVILTATLTYYEVSEEKSFEFTVTPVEEFPLAIKYDDFKKTFLLQFNGISGTIETKDSTGKDIKVLQFNNDRGPDGAKGGSVFAKDKILLGEDLSFSTAFSYRNPHPDYTTGTGGFIFTLQTLSNKVYGQALDDKGIKPSINIAFITDYRSGSGGGQGTFYFYEETVAVYYNGDYEHRREQHLTSGATNNPSLYNYIWIEYDGTAKQLEIRFSNDGLRPANSNLKIEDLDLAQILIGAGENLDMEDIQEVYAGFMGSVGNAKDKSEIHSWYLNNNFIPIDLTAYNFMDVSNVVLSADPSVGAASSIISVRVGDVEGNPVANIPVEFNTSLGILGSYHVITDASGKGSVTLSSGTSGTALVKAFVYGGATAVTEVQMAVNDEDRLNFDLIWLTDIVLGENSSWDSITVDLNLPATAPSGSAISWESSDSEVVNTDGVVTRPSIGEGEKTITLTAILSIDTIEKQKTFTVTVKVRDGDLVDADWAALTFDVIQGENESAEKIMSNLGLPTTGVNGSAISWQSDQEAIVTEKGIVNRPSHQQGDQPITLTATLSMGSYTREQRFSLIVIATEITEGEAARGDYEWLTFDIIRKENPSEINVMSDLYLPITGKYGSEISWSSSNEDFVTKDGTVKRPTYSEGTKYVTLTAIIGKAPDKYEKLFYVYIQPLATDSEAVEGDSNWLTERLILGEVNQFNQVIENLNLPTIGHRGSMISWTSSDERWVKPDGTVIRPTFLQRNRTVDLTAIISKEEQSVEKHFRFIVEKLPLTDEEAVFSDSIDINVTKTLSGNLSQYSINKDLSLPTKGALGTTITWASNMPSVITANGEVTIPEYHDGHKNVVLTATFIKGAVSKSTTYNYTVLSKPDTFMPNIMSTSPDNGSVALWNTREISITFDEHIKMVMPEKSINNYDITLNGPEAPGFHVSIFKDKLSINLTDYLKPGGSYRLTVPANSVSDTSNNTLNSEIKLEFTIEQKPMRKIEVISSSPRDKEKLVSREISHISFSYSYNDITRGSRFEDISLIDWEGNKIDVTKSLVDDTVTLTFSSGKKLQPGGVYEVIIPGNAVMDRFENGSSVKSIKFRIEGSATLPDIISYYPYDGQAEVDINQKIEIEFAQDVLLQDVQNFKVWDDKGNQIKVDITRYGGNNNKVYIKANTWNPFKPNTKYIVRGSYETAAGVGFEMSFTTGANKLSMTNLQKVDYWEMPINSPIEIEYSSAIIPGVEFSNIKLTDSEGNGVGYRINVEGKKAILSPNTPLHSSKAYSFFIPKGAFKSQDNIENDAYKISRPTAKPYTYGNYTFYSNQTGVTDQRFGFDASWLVKISRPLKSITWDFGDGQQGSGVSPETKYSSPGEYTVTLTLVDNMDISYQWKKNITINELNLEDLQLRVYPDEMAYLDIYDNNNPYGLKNTYEFDIQLYSPSSGWITDEEVKVSLYKNGILVENLGKVTIYGGSTFKFNYGNRGYFGNYELVFEYEKTNKRVRRPVVIRDDIEARKQNMQIYLYDAATGHRIMDNQQIYFDLNGARKFAHYEDGSYIILGIETGNSYSLKVSTSEGILYTSDEINVNHQGWIYPVVMYVNKKEPGLNYIKSAKSDSRHGNRYRGLFIKGISTPDMKFELSGNWDGLTPGYYELKSTMGSISLKSEKPVFYLQPGLEMHAGEELWGRMVSKSGVASLWWNANVTVAPYPSLGYGPKLDIRYVNGEYVVDSVFQISGLNSGGIGILDGVPLLDSADGFGLGGANNRFQGKISEIGFLDIAYESGAEYGSKTKKSKMLTTGYEVGADISFYGRLYYDRVAKDWKLSFYRYYLMGRGEYFWKKSYGIPKIDFLEGWGKVTIGSNIDALLGIDGKQSGDQEFIGIIGFEPYVDIEIGAGIQSTLSVEGSVTGSVPAEFHIPTGYIQVEPNIKAKIVAYYIFDNEVLYSKTIAKTHWDNGKEKVVLFSTLLEEGHEEEATGFTPMSRSYLERGSQWLPSSYKTITTFGAGSNPHIETMTENIYPRSEVQMTNSGDENWIVWTEDNPERDGYNRTQLKYSVFRDGIWKEAKWFGRDTTADFAPTVVGLEDGILLAWQNIKNPMLEEDRFSSFVRDAEISVVQSVYKADDREPGIVTLTDDSKYDHSPVLAADNGKAILVWIKSEGLSFTLGEEMDGLRSPENSDRLFSSVWNGSDWSTPEEIEGFLPTVLDASLTMHGDEGLLLYILDMDSNQLTQDDREIYYKIYNGTAWEGGVRLTNKIDGSSPKAVNINGEWFIIWYESGNIMYKTGLREDAKTHEALSGVPNNYEIAMLKGANPKLAIVYGTPSTNSTTTLYASFYDIENGVWSGGVTLSENQGHIRAFSPIFTEDGKLSVVYTQAEVIKQVIEEAEFMLPSDKVDLMILNYKPVHDLALDERMGLALMPAIPIKGTVTAVSLAVMNLGDFAEYATLYLYDGKPSLGRVLGKVTTSEPIPARSTAELEVEWLVGLEERDTYHLYAVVCSDEGIGDIDESNNILDHKIVTADIAITDLQWGNTVGNDYLVKATVTNTGNKKLEDITVQLVHKDRDKVLEKKDIDLIMPGQKIDLYFLFSSNGLAVDGYGGINMTLQAFLSDGMEEFSYENNTYGFVVEPTNIMVERMEPAPNELQANLDKPLTISFNRSVEKGAKFEQIELMDEELNLIEIDKYLEGKILTITPKYALENGTGYTLAIPDDAVSDSYGHKMDGPYSLSFATTSREPEVIFAYPGQGMEEIALNTEIKVRFNQEIIKGSTFNNITLYSNGTKIPISLTIEGEWLHINYAGLLSANRTYSLTVPIGAVQNYKEDRHQQDYVLVFMTGDGGKSDEPGGDGGNSGGNNDNWCQVDGDEDGYNNIRVVIGGVLQRLDVRLDSSRAIINLRNLAREIFSSNENVVINMPRISNVDAYTLEIDVEALTGENDNGTLTLNTSIGSLTIPAGMLLNMTELNGKIAEITITVADKSKLPQKVRNVIGNRPLVQFNLSIDGQQREWNNLARSVRVSIPYAPTEEERKGLNSIVIWYVDESGNLVCIPNGHYDLSSGTVTFTTTHFSYYAVGYNKVSFNDVAATAWYNKAVSFIAARKITSGTGGGNFSPELKLTRGQFIVMLMKAYNIAPDLNAKVNFTDAGNTYYTNYLAAAKRLGISAGVGNNMFAPEKEITRQELFTLLHNGLRVINKLPRGNSGKNIANFNDADEIALWARDAMTLLVETGIVGGSEGKLLPLSTATRAEMAGVLYKLLSK